NQSRANQSGDDYSQALTLAREGRTEEARAAFEKLEAEGYGAYPVLARMRAATLHAEAGDHAGAIAAFDQVSSDSAVPQAIRDMAKLRAALLLVDHGSYEDVSARVEALAVETNALRHSAREALGLSAWKHGRMEDAATLFTQIIDDEGAPQNMRQRAELMSELIRGSGSSS